MKTGILNNMQKGQSLIEALVALGAAVIIISAITITVISSLNNVEFSRDQNLASQYAKEGLELIRQINQDNSTFLTSLTNKKTYCLGKGETTPIEKVGVEPFSCGQNYNNFIREIEITPSSVECSGNFKIVATVYWTDGKCVGNSSFCHNVILHTCLSSANDNVVAP